MMISRRLKRFGGVLLALLVSMSILDWLFPLAIPSQSSERFARVVVDESGRPLRAFADKNGVWRYQVSIDDVSPLYVEALINYEDRWFWYHPGVNPLAIIRAAWQNMTNNRVVSGGSTLTMQVARLLHPHSRSIQGKLYQLFRTFQLEWHLSKLDILTLYLNTAPFGGTIEGVQAASFSYLEKSAKELSHAEAALLAVLPQAPTRYRPDLNAEAAEKARNKVLDRMQSLGIWQQVDVADAKIEQVFAYRAKNNHMAPLLARRLLLENPQKAVIKTTVDGEMQQALEQYLHSYIQQFPKGTSASVLVVDNRSSAVKAYLGSADFLDNSRFGHVDMVKASRSVGSTLKPFLFAMALEQGLIHSHSLLLDVPRTTGLYRPANFNRGFSGPVSATAALQRSLNVPFVDLLERLGPATFVDNLTGAGNPLDIPGGKANLAVILGGAGSSLERLVTGYTALAGKGKTSSLRFLQEQLAEPANRRHLMSEESAWITFDALSKISRPGSVNAFHHGSDAGRLAWKTGTSYGYRDTWAIGVSSEYTIGVWLGRPDGTPLPGHSGRETAGPLLFAVSDHIHQKISGPEKPENVRQIDICWPLGVQTDDGQLCHQKHQAWVIDDTVVPTWFGEEVYQSNPMPYWVNSESGLRVNAQCSAKVTEQKWAALWPRAVEPWLAWRYRKVGQLPKADPGCNGRLVENDNSLKIVGIESGSIYQTGGNSQTPPSVLLKAQGGHGRQHWYINGHLAYEDIGQSGINHQFAKTGQQQLLVVDDSGNMDKTTVVVR